jgi:hypothetical protein
MSRRRECIQWWGYIDPEGYGRTGMRRRSNATNAHRHVYIECFGPIPDDMVVDHLCRNRSCVNPEHIEVVTREENFRRGIHHNRTKTECPTCSGEYTVKASGVRYCSACHARLERGRRAQRKVAYVS